MHACVCVWRGGEGDSSALRQCARTDLQVEAEAGEVVAAGGGGRAERRKSFLARGAGLGGCAIAETQLRL